MLKVNSNESTRGCSHRRLGDIERVFMVDASVTPIRRMIRGDRWFEPHRMHAYQHLTRRWHSHLRVTLLGAAINVIWLFPWAWYASRYPAQAAYCVVGSLLPVIVLALLAGAGKP